MNLFVKKTASVKNSKWQRPGLLITMCLILLVSMVRCKLNNNDNGYASIDENSVKEESLQHFEEITKVLRHPRCINCHPNDNYPRQGDDMHKHLFNVQRGPEDRGMTGMKCTSCHQASNNLVSGVPGAPQLGDSLISRWHLAPLSMGWIGLDDAELGARLLDKKQNGNMSPKDLVEHMRDDPLVLWAWNPGPGREPISIPHDEFVEILEKWLETGAEVPKK
ncbi:hypothetical protein [uncultured Aquimarina sp.]|uniref:hypothetical protein n=1 Tax=uncultured Aquimarina sp. TaxID=575652 RepID=UPI002603DEF3|nr:hypothetical protein [uncultured Aquimarina sp.]